MAALRILFFICPSKLEVSATIKRVETFLWGKLAANVFDIGDILPNHTEVEEKILSVFYCRSFSVLLQKFLLNIFTWTE